MVSLGWYLDVFGSESHVLVWVFEKNLKKKENGNLGKTGTFAAAKGTFVAAKSFVATKGCLAAARPRARKAPPGVRCNDLYQIIQV